MNQFIVSFHSMAINRVIHDLIAAQYVAFLNSIRKRSILNRSPLDRNLHLVFATLRQPTEEVYQCKFEQNYYQHEHSFSHNHCVSKNSIEVVAKEFKVQLDKRSICCEDSGSGVAPNRETGMRENDEGEEVDDGLVEGFIRRYFN